MDETKYTEVNYAKGTTMYKNRFTFCAKKGVDNIEFTFKYQYMVTSGQPWGGVDSVNGKTTVKSGRKLSKECVPLYEDTANCDKKHMIHTSGGDHYPKKLNFAIKGILKINTDEYEVCLAQGHHNLSNNWHLASTDLIAEKDGKKGIIALKYRISQKSNDSMEIEIL